MTMQLDPVLNIVNRIARRTERIAKWDKQAAEIETTWSDAVAYRKFCNSMGRAARSKKTELEAELLQLRGCGTPSIDSPGNHSVCCSTG